MSALPRSAVASAPANASGVSPGTAPATEPATVPATRLLRLLDAAAAHAIPARHVLEGTGLGARSLRCARERIAAQALIRALDNALAAGLPQETALDSAERTLADYGLLGYAMMSCATLEQAIRIAMRYYRTLGPLLALRFRVERGRAVLELDDELGLADLDLLPWVVESVLAPFPALLAELLGAPIANVELRLAHARPAHGDRLERHFAAPIRFEAGTNQFRFDAAALEQPLVRADARTASLFERSCRSLLAELHGEPSLASRIGRDLLAHPGDLPDAARMAERLNMSTRTLRRRLAEQGTSYQAVVDRVRRRIAEDYLRSTSLPVQEIAELLGYTEATNFRRAFLKWTGETPLACRMAHRTP